MKKDSLVGAVEISLAVASCDSAESTLDTLQHLILVDDNDNEDAVESSDVEDDFRMKDQNFIKAVLKERKLINEESMHIPASLFNRIGGCITCEYKSLSNVARLVGGKGGNGTCYTADINDDTFNIHEKVLFKWVNENNPIMEIAYLHNVWCLGHPNFVKAATVWHDGKMMAIIVRLKSYERFAVTMQPVSKTTRTAEERLLRENVLIFARLADSVNFLHYHGLRHWDLHDENYIINEYGEPIIIDFGGMSNHEARLQSYPDVHALLAAVGDLNLDDCNIAPFRSWAEMFSQQYTGSYPGDVKKLCEGLGDLSVGALKETLGETPKGVKVRYVHLAAVDIKNLSPGKGLEIATCYEIELRQLQVDNITKATK